MPKRKTAAKDLVNTSLGAVFLLGIYNSYK
jgi:hypothetical protein